MDKTRQLIDTAWQAWWDALAGGPPFKVEYHQQQWQQPDSGPYGRLSLTFGDVVPGAIGPDMERCECLLCLQIFLPKDGNYSTVTQTRDKISTFWRYKQFDNTTDNVRRHLDFGVADLTAAGARDGYKQYNVWVNFRCDKYFLS